MTPSTCPFLSLSTLLLGCASLLGCARAGDAAAESDETSDDSASETDDSEQDDVDGGAGGAQETDAQRAALDELEAALRAERWGIALEPPDVLPELVAGDGPHPDAPWDWAGIVGTGQSLSVGTQPVNDRVNESPYENLMLDLGDAEVQPFDADSDTLSIAPLEEPLRSLQTSYPSPYPGNLYGETPHGSMAIQISSLVQASSGASYTTVHTVVGESGQGMVALRKDAADDDPAVGRAYAATLFEVQAIARLAREQGQTYGVAAIFLTHGETDSGSSSYGDAIVQLWNDYNTDLQALTGQTQEIQMFISQQHAYGYEAGSIRGTPVGTLAQWLVARDTPGIVCTGPKYQYPYHTDNIHLTALGYEMLGEKYGQVYTQHMVEGRAFRPLEPTEVERAKDDTLRIRFHVPVGPLQWEERLPAPHQLALTMWSRGRGFELRKGATRLAIADVELVGDDSVELTTQEPLPEDVTLSYAMYADGITFDGLARRWGQLRDSDPFVGAVTGIAQPNYAVAFEMRVP